LIDFITPFFIPIPKIMKLNYSTVKGSLLSVKEDRRTEVYNFGSDNAFPSLVETLARISVTTKTCIDRVAKAIYGDSFGELGKVKVNSKGQTLNEVLRIASREYAKHNNLFLQVGYNSELVYNSIVVIPVIYSRIGKSDDLGYSGRFVVYENWDKTKGSKIMSDKFKIIDNYNPKEEVVRKQFEKYAAASKDYYGQIIHIKKDTTGTYAISDIFPVLEEALLEANSQKFRSRGSSKGFLNIKLIATQPMDNDDQRKAFKKDLNDVRGAENSSEVVHLEATAASKDLSKELYIGDLSSPYNDKLFEYSDSQAEKNICKAFTVPIILVNPSDSSMFGNNGTLIVEAKKQLFESREEDRDQLEEVFIKIMKKFVKPVIGLKIINPFEEVIEEAEEEAPRNANAEAQANLRGSVGGVTSLLSIATSVAQKVITIEQGVSMIKNIFGFAEDIAKEMLEGTIIEEEVETEKEI
jgi:hypothetical protein